MSAVRWVSNHQGVAGTRRKFIVSNNDVDAARIVSSGVRKLRHFLAAGMQPALINARAFLSRRRGRDAVGSADKPDTSIAGLDTFGLDRVRENLLRGAP